MIGTIIGAIKGHREGWGIVDTILGGLSGLLVDVVIGAIGLGVGFGVHAVKRDNENINNRIQIEENVAKSAGFAKFTGNAFTVTQKDGKFYTEMFGVAVENVGDAPTFSSVTYEIDKETYDDIFKYVDIKYEYGTSGQLTSAKNQLRKPDFWFGSYKSNEAYNDVLNKLVEITQNEVVSKRFYASSEDTNTAVYYKEQSNFLVNGIGQINYNRDKSKVSFTIDFIDVTTSGEVTAKRLLVIQDVTPEMLNNPMKVYESYTKNYQNCIIEEMELGKTVLHEMEHDGVKYTVSIDNSDSFTI